VELRLGLIVERLRYVTATGTALQLLGLATSASAGSPPLPSKTVPPRITVSYAARSAACVTLSGYTGAIFSSRGGVDPVSCPDQPERSATRGADHAHG
jgi:hypothetical protein